MTLDKGYQCTRWTTAASNVKGCTPMCVPGIIRADSSRACAKSWVAKASQAVDPWVVLTGQASAAHHKQQLPQLTWCTSCCRAMACTLSSGLCLGSMPCLRAKALDMRGMGTIPGPGMPPGMRPGGPPPERDPPRRPPLLLLLAPPGDSPPMSCCCCWGAAEGSRPGPSTVMEGAIAAAAAAAAAAPPSGDMCTGGIW
jgi:hypothetical protein